MRDLRAIVEAATPAEWTARTHYSSWGTWWSVDPVTDMWKDDHEEANAEFIATFDPEMVGKLLDIVQAAQAVVDSPYVRDAEAKTVQNLGGALAALDTEDNQ